MDNSSRIQIHISHDKMAAYIRIEYSEEAPGVGREEITAALAAQNIAGGVKEDEIDRVSGRQIYNEDVLIAEGRQPENGRDGKVEYFFDLSGEMQPKVLGDGKVDYYDMNIINPVNKNDVLCRLHQPTQGTDGYNVFGAALASKNGKPAQLPRGRNTAANEAGDELRAAIDGQIKRNGKNIDVIQEFEVKKNVDFSTGNIQFPGSVVVRGNVVSGFVVQSGGDVTIYGLVEKASITAFGNIILHGGMTGQGSGTLRAGGDIFAKYVENSHITASGRITAECIMHSTVRAGVGIELIGRKGLLVGGSAKAREYIRAITIGSQFATLTEINVGSDPKLNDRLKDIKAEIIALETDHKKTEQAVSMFRAIESSGTKLTPQKALMCERAKTIYAEQDAKLASLRTEHDNIEAVIKKNVHGYVRVNNLIYSGVKVSIANNNMMLKEDVKFCSLKSDGDSIRIAPY